MDRVNWKDGEIVAEKVLGRAKPLPSTEIRWFELGRMVEGGGLLVIMPTRYRVKQGDCIDSIAADHGLLPDTLWNHADNVGLREARRDPNILLPGDQVIIPDIAPKQESGETELRHRFARRGVPAMMRICLFEEALPQEGSASELTEEDEPPPYDEVDEEVPDLSEPLPPPEQQEEERQEPRANEPYELIVDGRSYTGYTDEDGALRVPIPPKARDCQLWVGEGPDRKLYEFHLGQVDPVDELTGVQERLNNLGFDCGAVDGQYGPQTRAALERFQQRHGLTETGQPDAQTKQRLVEQHGS